MIRKRVLAAVAIFAIALATGSGANADSVEDFYKNKTLTIVVGFGAGGSYGIYGRLLANAMRKYVPGNPAVTPQFMPGGGSLKAINYLYNAAPQDGTYIGMGIPQLAFNQLIFTKGIKFDMRHFSYIGRLADDEVVFMVRSDAPGGGTVAGAKERQVVVGGSGKGTHTYMIPAAMNRLVGTKFKIVLGYKGAEAEWLAMERNEIQGMTGAWLNWQSAKQDWIDKKFIRPIVVVGMSPNPDLPNVPLLIDLAVNASDRQVLEFISSPTQIGRSVLAPPNVPAARVAVLRAAFQKAVKDKDFLAGAEKVSLPVRAASGDEIQAAVQKVLSSSPELVKRVKDVLDAN